MGTLNENYDAAFEEVTTRTKNTAAKIENHEIKTDHLLAISITNDYDKQGTGQSR
jgi:hypothetical protein